jgi:Cu-Zn family superoxide dismutase
MARIAVRISVTVVVAVTWALLTLVLPIGAAQPQTQPGGATADVRDASGKSVATAELHEDQGKVQVALVLPSPSTLTGKHALHIMEIGRCDGPSFASAGGIFNPLGKKHGILASGGAMVGDLPNLTMPLQRYNAPALGASLGPGPTSLLGPRGTALVIYAGEDDGLTDPEGNAGARIACGVIAGTGQVAAAASSPPQPTAAASGSNAAGLTLGPAVIIVVLGAALIGAGLLLRSPRRSAKP